MLGNYLLFNDTVFPNPVTPTMTMKAIEKVTQSEAGTDLVIVTRAAKRTWKFNFNLSYAKKEVLKELCKEEKVTMTYMGIQYTVRVRDFNEKLVEGSEWVSNINGLYECSVAVTEY